MTLIAAFRTSNVPALVGDLLVTRRSDLRHHKKLTIVASNLAVGWTGDLEAAKEVLRVLHLEFSQSSRRVADLEGILTRREQPFEIGRLHVTLIGWILRDDHALCFRWNSGCPIELFYGDPMYDGSGDAVAEQLFLHKEGNLVNGAHAPADPHHVAFGVLGPVTRLMKAEMLGPSNVPFGIGLAYDVILRVNDTFEYLSDIFYYSVVHRLDHEGHYLESHFIGKPFKVRVASGYSIIWSFEPDTKHQTRYVVAPVGTQPSVTADELIEEQKLAAVEFPFDSNYFCGFVVIEAPGYTSPQIVELVDRAKASDLFTFNEPNCLSLQVDPKRIEWMYRSIRVR